MKSLRYTRVVVIADTVSGCSVMARLRQMELLQVAAVAGLQQARAICRDGGADACLVIRHNSDFDDRPLTAAEEDAPGRATGVPSLLLADVVTPHLRKAARRRDIWPPCRRRLRPGCSIVGSVERYSRPGEGPRAAAASGHGRSARCHRPCSEDSRRAWANSASPRCTDHAFQRAMALLAWPAAKGARP